MSLTPGEVVTRAPLLGEHNAEILGERGMDPDEIAKLAAQGII
jgi:crotonobetainyl-CoA:carnitine CoA-transferase CaiB-like acyl-CoA transferase